MREIIRNNNRFSVGQRIRVIDDYIYRDLTGTIDEIRLFGSKEKKTTNLSDDIIIVLDYPTDLEIINRLKKDILEICCEERPVSDLIEHKVSFSPDMIIEEDLYEL